MARIRLALVTGCLVAALTTAARADAIGLQPVGTFDSPTYVTSPPGDPRLFVVERAGTIQVVDQGTTTKFLDMSAMTTTEGERGLLSMAFDPNYAANGLFYVFYTGDGTDSGGTLGQGHVDEYRVSADPDLADQGSRRQVLTITRPNDAIMHHNGGQLQFGRDGLLYISVGDGGTGGDPAPDLSVLNGKLVRVDPHGASPGAYGIPPSNPFVSSGSDRPEIWSYGFRNPWRFSFDHLTGDLVIGDVGQVDWEEVDFAPASAELGRGVNWGWNTCEGSYAYDRVHEVATSSPCSTSGATNPTFAYPHSDPGGDVAYGCAVIGGYVYRGNQIPELSGRYLYADLCTGELRSAQLGSPPAGGDRPESASGAISPSSFGEDSSCELYVTDGDLVDKIVPSLPTAAAPACSTTPATPATPATQVRTKKKCKRHKKHGVSAKGNKKKHCKKRKRRQRRLRSQYLSPS
jgi:glucose/arabinose dehydrogenase